jgi:hypothetical protein
MSVTPDLVRAIAAEVALDQIGHRHRRRHRLALRRNGNAARPARRTSNATIFA